MVHKTKYFCLWLSACFIGFISIAAVEYLSESMVIAAQSGSPFKVQMQVELTTVQVSVQDKNGKSMHNLRMEDFELYENGKRQDILSIDEINANDAEISLGVNPLGGTTRYKGKTVLLVFDDSSTRISRDPALKFVRNYMRPQDLFAVAVFGTSMQILQQFASDKSDVLSAIEKVPAAAIKRDTTTAYNNNLYSTLKTIIPSIAPIKGQKSIILYLSLAADKAAAVVADPTKVIMSRLDFIDRDLLETAKKANVVFFVSCTDGLCNSSLANASGGFSLRNAAGSEEDFAKLDQQLSNYYVLGFNSTQSKQDGRFRKIEAKVKIKGSIVRFPSGYQAQRPVDISDNTDQEKALLTAMAYPSRANIAPLIFSPIYFYDSPQIARVLVSAGIPMNYAEYKHNGKTNAELSIMGAAYSENGMLSARFSDTLPISLNKKKEIDVGNKMVVYRNYFRLRPGTYRLKLAVASGLNVLATVEKSVEIPQYPDKGLHPSSLVVVQQAAQTSEPIRNIQDQMLDEADPLVYAGKRIEPSIGNRVAVGTSIPVLFRLYNLQTSSDGWHLTAKTKLLGEKGEIYQGDAFSPKDSVFPEGQTKAILGLMLSFPKAPAGKYRLILEVGPSGLAETANLETDLELVK